jgi:hypothetical protein
MYLAKQINKKQLIFITNNIQSVWTFFQFKFNLSKWVDSFYNPLTIFNVSFSNKGISFYNKEEDYSKQGLLLH